MGNAERKESSNGLNHRSGTPQMMNVFIEGKLWNVLLESFIHGMSAATPSSLLPHSSGISCTLATSSLITSRLSVRRSVLMLPRPENPASCLVR